MRVFILLGKGSTVLHNNLCELVLLTVEFGRMVERHIHVFVTVTGEKN